MGGDAGISPAPTFLESSLLALCTASSCLQPLDDVEEGGGERKSRSSLESPAACPRPHSHHKAGWRGDEGMVVPSEVLALS